MKILHTADWHIGRQFHNVSLLEDQRHVLGQIIRMISEEGVEVVIIAGDIYDRSVPPADAVKLLDETLHSIVSDLGVPVRGAVLERRWATSSGPEVRNGDRLYVGTGSELVLYDRGLFA